MTVTIRCSSNSAIELALGIVFISSSASSMSENIKPSSSSSSSEELTNYKSDIKTRHKGI